MRILLVNSVYGSGSTGRICAQLASSLTHAGNDCLVVYGRGEKKPLAGESLLRVGSDAEVRLHGAATRLLDANGLVSRRATGQLLRAMQAFDPDVIHLHNIHGYYLQFERLFDELRKCGKPIVWTLHDCWPFTGHCAYFDMAHCDRWKTGCGDCPQRGAYPASLLIDGSARNWQRRQASFSGLSRLVIVTPSEWLANHVRHSFLGAYPTVVIPNGVDTAVFRPRPAKEVRAALPKGIEPGQYLLGVANAWEPRKGLQDFFKLSARIAGTPRKLLLVGLNDAQLRALPSTVFGIKRTSSAQALAALYTGCAAYLNLTYEENYPTTNLEAAACGANVITYSSGGCAETLHAHSRAVPTGDLDAVEHLVRALPLPARQDAPSPPLDAEDCVARYLRLYQSVLS